MSYRHAKLTPRLLSDARTLLPQPGHRYSQFLLPSVQHLTEAHKILLDKIGVILGGAALRGYEMLYRDQVTNIYNLNGEHGVDDDDYGCGEIEGLGGSLSLVEKSVDQITTDGQSGGATSIDFVTRITYRERQHSSPEHANRLAPSEIIIRPITRVRRPRFYPTSRGLPRHIFNTLNQTETAKEIWENVELLMQGSGLTEQQKKETLFDQYERFWANGNESIHDYFVRFHKLINDMNITKCKSIHQEYQFINTYPSYGQVTKQPLTSQYVPSPPQYAPAPQQAPQSTNDAMLATMNQIVNLLTGQITIENVQRRALGNKGKHAATGSQGKVVTCYNCRGQGHVRSLPTTAFEVSHERCIRILDVDESTSRSSKNSMANLIANDHLLDRAPVSQEIHEGEQLDSMFDSVIDAMITLFQYLNTKLKQRIESVFQLMYLPVIACLYDTFVPQKQLSSEQVYWLPANEVASFNCCLLRVGIEENLFKEVSEYMKIFDELDKEYDQCVIDKKSLEIENKNLLIQNECLLAESVSKDICSVVLTSDIVVPMSVEPRSNCVEEHSRNLELEAEILKMKQLLKRNNKEANTPLPRKEIVSLVKKSSVCVNLSTRIKSVTKASESKSKYETKTHRNLPARSENVKRVDNSLRSLNKRNRVDSSLRVKLSWARIDSQGIHVDPAKIEAGEDQESAFQLLKQKLCEAPILALLEGNDDFVVYCNASHQGLGAVLMQREKVIAYASRQLKPHEENYTIHDLELGAVVFALKIWRHCLVKAECQKPTGLLIQPKIPTWKWERITMDFVTKLPQTSSGHDTIWVIVDRLTKSAHFIPTKATDSMETLTKLYIKEIISCHGVPISIISDRDSHFTSKSWQSMQSALGTAIRQ
ncbi:reverse transcriptase domain-containing protein [Tanacetum coccineum]